MQARAIPIRGDRRRRTPRRWRRTPFAAVALSLLAFLSPTLTLAPLQASEPHPAAGPRPLDEPEHGPRRPSPIDVAGPVTPVAGPSTAPSPTIAADGPRFAAALDAARTAASAYGVTFAAVRDGELVWTGATGRERDGATPLTPASEMVIGSVTKTYVAATILQLAAEGRLELDDTVRSQLPDLRSISRRITLRQLLDHTSGLADLFNDTTRLGLETDPDHGWTADELLDTLHEPWYRPGEGWAYANTNYYLLGLVIERVTGSTLEAELRARFLDTLGLYGTSVLDGAAAPDGPLDTAWTSVFWASGAMSATAADLARWGDALYAGTVLPDAGRAEMGAFNDHEYGLGSQHIRIGRFEGIGHTGLLNTYTSLLVHLPDEDVTIALLVNRSDVNLAGMLTARPAGGPSLLRLAIGGDR
jgi:D-alanyl-D-alanine carboxypeptidase